MKKNSILRTLIGALASIMRAASSLTRRPHRALVLLLVGVAVCIAPLVSLSQIKKASPLAPAARAGVTPQGSEESILSSGQAPTSRGIAAPHETKGTIYTDIPPHLHEKENEIEEAEVPVPQGKVWAVIPAPTDPPTEATRDFTPQAPNDMRYQVVHDISAAEVATSQRSTVHEPSVGNMGNTIFWSSNWYAARSTNGGSTFTFVSPSTTFPSINEGFCCDQIVNYARNQDMMLWALQYDRDSSSGTLRIARAVGSAAVASNSWIYYDFDPQDFGFAANIWMDFPNLTVSSNFLYCSSNVFDTVSGCPNSCAFRGSVVWRISLSELAAGGFINFNYFTRTDVGSPRCTEGATTTMYWAAFQDTSTLRIHRWDDSSATIFWDNIALNPFTFLRQDGVATSPDGTNWAARASTRVLGATVTGGVLAFMWPAKQDSSFPYPYTVVGRFSQATRALLGQQAVWNSSFAWLYMSGSVNAAGNQAGLIAWGGGAFYPNSAVWVNDDVQPGFAPLNNYLASESNDGPNRNVWGDYLTVRPHKNFVNSWVAATYYMTTGGENGNAVGRYIWFGRERDLASFGSDTIGVYFPSNRTFYLRNSNTQGNADLPIQYGPNSITPIVGDWNGDGVTTIGVYDPATRTFYLRNSNAPGNADIQIQYGPPGAIPLAGDWNGDGTDTIGVYDSATRTFYLRNSNTQGNADIQIQYGPSGSVPVVGDWNADGITTIGVYETSTRTFYLRNSNTLGNADIQIQYGPPGSVPTVGDFDGNGSTTIGVYETSTRTFYLKNSNTLGNADIQIQYGPSGAIPLIGDWDGL